MRKIIFGLAATAAVAVPLVLAGPASAATTAPSGSTVFLSKSALQSTLHLNNAGFDTLTAKDFKATGTLLAVQEVHFNCDGAEVSHYDWPTAYADAITVKPVLNGGGNQITGYNVTDLGMTGEPAVRNPINWDQVNSAWNAAAHSPCGDATGSATSAYRYDWTPLDVTVNGTSVATFQHVTG